MKVVVSSTGKTLDSNVDTRFGRCQYFLIVETENNQIKNVLAVQNQGALQGHGAGIRAAEQVGEIKPDAVITGNLGPNASNVFNQLKIEVYQGSGTAKDAVIKFLAGGIEKLTNIAREHSGMN